MQITCAFYYLIIILAYYGVIKCVRGGVGSESLASVLGDHSIEVEVGFQDSQTFRKSRQDDDEDEEEESSPTNNSNQNQTSAFEMFILQVLPAVNGLFRGFTNKLKESPAGMAVKEVEQVVDKYKTRIVNQQLGRHPPTPKLEDPPRRVEVLYQTSPLPSPTVKIAYPQAMNNKPPPPDIDLGAFTTTIQPRIISQATRTTTKKTYYYNPKIKINEIRTQETYGDYDEKEPSRISFQLTTTKKPSNKRKETIENQVDEIPIDDYDKIVTIEPSKLGEFISKYQYTSIIKE